ncbi:hypothetical protein [Empedobacter stercoris]|uniref:hypothetical protein n=1 Tax=Empedobacter stercoris TaxID=1628248 RepID=UPI0039E894D4
MKNKFLSILIVFGSFALAQNLSTKDGGTIYNSQNYVVDKDNVNDNFYLNKQYINGTVKNYAGLRGYRYNAFTDDFEFLENNELFNLEKQDGLEITLVNGQVFKYLTFYDDNGVIQKGYLQVLSNIKLNNVLYKSTRIFKSELGNTNSYNNMSTVKFRTMNNYYIDNEGFIKQVAKSNKELSKVAKENKLNINKERDLIKLVDILNK